MTTSPVQPVQTQTIELPIGRRYASIVPPAPPADGEKAIAIVDPETRTCRISFSSELPQQRFDWDLWEIYNEVLDHSPDSVNLERCNSAACPLLWNHNRDDQRGIVQSAEIEDDRRAYAEVRFSRSAEGEQLMNDVNDGIVTGVSFAYRVYEMELTKKAAPPEYNTYTATDWEVIEISFCSIPADPTVGPGKSEAEAGDLNTVLVKGEPMTTQTTQTTPRPPRKNSKRSSSKKSQVEEAAAPQLDPETADPVTLGEVTGEDEEAALEPIEPLERAIADLEQTYGVQIRMTTNATGGSATPPEDRPIENLSAKLQLEREKEARAALEKRLATLEADQSIGLKCSKQQRRAQLLKAAGKLSPAMLKALFGTDDDTPLEIYKSHQSQDPVEFFLDVIEHHGSQLVDFKSYIGETPLVDPPQEPTEAPREKATAIYSRLKDQGTFSGNG
jgi:HK97 family phage prohead protease